MTDEAIDKKCQHAGDAVAYIQGELPSDESMIFSEHLTQCPDCRGAVQAFGRIIEDLSSVDMLSPSPELTDQIVEACRNSSVSRHALRIRWMPYSRIAALFVALAVGSWLFMDFQKSSISERDHVLASTADWLVDVQDEDGSWAPVKWDGRDEFEVALTSMSLMTLLQSTDPSNPQQAAIARAVHYLTAQQAPSGLIGPSGIGMMYNQGIATTALLGAYERERDPELKEALDRALAYIRSTQGSDGGWGYAHGQQAEANTAVSVWQLHALYRAKQAGIPSEGNSLRRGLFWLQSLVSDRGFVGYQNVPQFRRGSESLTAMGAFCLFEASDSFAGLDEMNGRLSEALAAGTPSHAGAEDFYRSYFLSLAMQSRSGPESEKMLKAVQRDLLESRVSEGIYKGTWDPVGRWSQVGGRLYSTCLAALSLHAG